MNTFFRIFLVLTIASFTQLQAQVPGVDHVVVLGVDGMSPAGIQRATTPNFNRVLNEGAFSFKARGVMGTSSSQNWASMIMGAGPEQHGITSNGWMPDSFNITPTTTGMEDIFPTIFGVLRQREPSAIIAAYYDWGGFGRLFEKSAMNKDVDGDGPEDTMNQAVAFLKEAQPRFTFIHLDHVDHALHTYGHGSEEYYLAIEETDALLGQLLEGLSAAGMDGSTSLIISADHGGLGTRHGGESMDELEIPWIMTGAGAKKGKHLTDPINTYDTASTSAYLLGLDQPYHWIARPVLSAIDGQADQVAVAAMSDFVPMPRIQPEGGIVEDLKSFSISSDWPDTEIRYTMDGSIPTRSSMLYSGPQNLDATANIKARAFSGSQGESGTTSGLFLSKNNGLLVSYYEGDGWDKLPDFSQHSPVRVDTVSAYNLGMVSTRDDYFAVRFEGFIDIKESETYTFFLMSDDGSNLYLDGELVIDNDGAGGSRENSGSRELSVGRHAITVDYFDTYGDEVFKVTYSTSTKSRQAIPRELLFLTPSNK